MIRFSITVQIFSVINQISAKQVRDTLAWILSPLPTK